MISYDYPYNFLKERNNSKGAWEILITQKETIKQIYSKIKKWTFINGKNYRYEFRKSKVCFSELRQISIF